MRKIIPFLSLAVALAGCDAETAPKKKTAETKETTADLPTDTFAYDEAAESTLDANAFLNANTKEDYHVATLYLEGGTGKNCAKWDITISGEDLKLARGDQLKAEHQTRLAEDPSGTLVGSLETRGAIPGIRFVVKKDSIVTFTGSQSYCKSDDKADFSVQENVEKSKLHEIFRGVEVKGIGFMTLKFSDEKNAETVAKIKAEIPAAETPPTAETPTNETTPASETPATTP